MQNFFKFLKHLFTIKTADQTSKTNKKKIETKKREAQEFWGEMDLFVQERDPFSSSRHNGFGCPIEMLFLPHLFKFKGLDG